MDESGDERRALTQVAILETLLQEMSEEEGPD